MLQRGFFVFICLPFVFKGAMLTAGCSEELVVQSQHNAYCFSIYGACRYRRRGLKPGMKKLFPKFLRSICGCELVRLALLKTIFIINLARESIFKRKGILLKRMLHQQGWFGQRQNQGLATPEFSPAPFGAVTKRHHQVPFLNPLR